MTDVVPGDKIEAIVGIPRPLLRIIDGSTSPAERWDYEPGELRALHSEPCRSHRGPCICRVVEEAEQRERERILNDWSLGQMQGNSNGEWILNIVRQKNYTRGLQSARDAVAAMPSLHGLVICTARADAIAAIDALRTPHE